jgi:hypothetical protein
LNDERSRYIAVQSKTQAATNTLDSVIIATIHDQAGKKNFEFK